jgi:hypothetical protein
MFTCSLQIKKVWSSRDSLKKHLTMLLDNNTANQGFAASILIAGILLISNLRGFIKLKYFFLRILYWQ